MYIHVVVTLHSHLLYQKFCMLSKAVVLLLHYLLCHDLYIRPPNFAHNIIASLSGISRNYCHGRTIKYIPTQDKKKKITKLNVTIIIIKLIKAVL